MQFPQPTKAPPKFAERFIPNRTAPAHPSFNRLTTGSACSFSENTSFSQLLKTQLFHSQPYQPLFSFSYNKENAASLPFPPPSLQRKIVKKPYKVLDAPTLQDDFYLNLIDWSAENSLSVGLGSSVYL